MFTGWCRPTVEFVMPVGFALFGTTICWNSQPTHRES